MTRAQHSNMPMTTNRAIVYPTHNKKITTPLTSSPFLNTVPGVLVLLSPTVVVRDLTVIIVGKIEHKTSLKAAYFFIFTTFRSFVFMKVTNTFIMLMRYISQC